MERIWIFFFLVAASLADNLNVIYEWKELDFEFPSQEDREEAIRNGSFIPENNLPLGLEVYGDRLFITVPRWKFGVAASLTYINLTDKTPSPKLRPYPDWEAHNLHPNNTHKIISPFRVRADRCGRLWVLDTGREDIVKELDKVKVHRPPQLLVYDLRTDALIREHPLPDEQRKNESFFATLAVEDHDCNDTRVYMADVAKPAIVVYSWKKQRSWRVSHNFFHPDPSSGEFNVSDFTFAWDDGIFGMALSKPDSEGFSTLYFHPMVSTDEFAVSTKYLQDPDLAKSNYNAFKRLGSRGKKAQSGVSFLDQKTGVLFYALVNLNAVACWRTSNLAYTMESQGRIYMDKETMIFPDDIKVDSEDRLWVLSDRLPIFLYGTLDPNDVNYRILMAPVADAIKGTACDSKLVVSPEIVQKLKPKNSDKKSAGVKAATDFGLLAILFVAIWTL